MSTSLSNAEIELSKQLGDYWDSTTTSAGDSGGYHLTDTALKEKEDDWVNDTTYDQITSGTYGYATAYDAEERKVKALANESGTLGLVKAHTGQIATSVDYRVHRLFSASEKKRALIRAAKDAFPHIHSPVWDESHVVGNWLKDGSFEIWTSTSNLTYWTETTSTATQTSTSPYYAHGSYSCKLDTAAGTLSQTITDFDDLKYLAGKHVTFTVQGWCDTASCLRLGIYDGSDTTYSDYHDGDSAWTEYNDPLKVEADIADNPTTIVFYIYHANASGTSYVDDARVISGMRNRVYIGDLSLANSRPHLVQYELTNYSQYEPWATIHKWDVDSNGYLYLPGNINTNRRLRIRGINYLGFLVSGSASTAWAATIAIDDPQLQILVAQAAVYLCQQMVMPLEDMAKTERWEKALVYWKREFEERRLKFSMPVPTGTIKWRT